MGGVAAHRPGRESHKKSAEEVLGMPNVSLRMVEDIMADVMAEEAKEKQQSTVDDEDSGEMTEDLTAAAMMIPTPSSVYDTVEASVKYKSYVVRQEKDIESWRRSQGVKIPPNIIYNHSLMPTFSKEEIEKLDRYRPTSFAEASQISGLTPQSLVYLYHHVMKLNKETRREKREENAVI
jgi:tRNA uridine 5-carboxymethylaminomethyl modification enzyme